MLWLNHRSHFVSVFLLSLPYLQQLFVLQSFLSFSVILGTPIDFALHLSITMATVDFCMFSTASFPCTVVTLFRAFHTDLPGYSHVPSLHISATFTMHDYVRLLGFGLSCSLTLMHGLM